MSERDFPDFNDYVYEYHESIHSGVGANVNRLNPQYEYSDEQRAESLKSIEQYAETSITAYRAIEWWANMRYGPITFVTQDGKSTLARDILARVKKPTRYMKPTVEWVEITE